jgi:3-oxoacyl-[acyl-carrier protein] reductase
VPDHQPKGTALVTGASRGLGAAIARRLAATGRHTVICSRSQQDLDTCVKSAAEEGLELHAFRADVTEEASVEALFSHLSAEAPPLDLCVNNAGRNYSHRLVGVRPGRDGTTLLSPHPVEDFERTVRLCLTGVFFVGRAAAAAMLAAGTPGASINISSTVRRGAYGQSAHPDLGHRTRRVRHPGGGRGARCARR